MLFMLLSIKCYFSTLALSVEVSYLIKVFMQIKDVCHIPPAHSILFLTVAVNRWPGKEYKDGTGMFGILLP